MISQTFAQCIAAEFPHQFTAHQEEAAEHIGQFLADPRTDQAFILRGYAGTGKTSLVAAVVKVWQRLERPVVLLAPTGRAAKVFSQYAGVSAFTIHKVIYRQQTFNGEETLFQRGWNGAKGALFIVDEASMVANVGGNSIFGTGRLMDDLIEFIYGGEGCRLMLVGDTAQLPPVGEEESPALQPATLEGYGLNVRMAELTEVVRQTKQSAVLRNATNLRRQISRWSGEATVFPPNRDSSPLTNEQGLPLISIDDKSEVRVVSGEDLLDALDASYREWGTQETIVLTRSNKRANIYNNGIRIRNFDYDDILCGGDKVMAVKNNYFWVARTVAQSPADDMPPMSFVANGDMAEVVRYRNLHEEHGFLFADATLRFPDYQNYELDCRVLLNTLQSEAPALSQLDSARLYDSVLQDYADIKNRRERMKAIRQDPYYNAIQIKYAYAVTCHKSQGGQWHEVYVDQGFIPDDAEPVSYLRWLYTAFTRTSGNLYLVNWPVAQVEFSKR